MLQSTLCQPQVIIPHLAAVMDAGSLASLPLLAGACNDLGIATLTVCTLPPDLRLADPREAGAMLDDLADALAALGGAHLSLIGRRYYLPSRLTGMAEASATVPSPFHLRIALDYACKASLLSHGSELPPASLLLLPDGLEPGNLLRWHYARAAKVRIDWPSFGADSLETLLDDLPPGSTRVSRRSSD